jgi:excisionase family DNA binding protein
MPKIWTPEEIADYLKVNKDVVLQELERGNLEGFKVGGEWRSSDTDLLAYMSRGRSRTQNYAMESKSMAEDTPSGQFIEAEPFEYAWPKTGGGKYIERFNKAYETTREFNGEQLTFKIGFGEREAAGLLRPRVVVWLDNRALVEFAGGNNYKSDGILASIIKLPDGKQVSNYRKVPADYAEFHIERYDSIVKGPYASKGLGIVVHKDDLESMVHHAMIRARWKELI